MIYRLSQPHIEANKHIYMQTILLAGTTFCWLQLLLSLYDYIPCVCGPEGGKISQCVWPYLPLLHTAHTDYYESYWSNTNTQKSLTTMWRKEIVEIFQMGTISVLKVCWKLQLGGLRVDCVIHTSCVFTCLSLSFCFTLIRTDLSVCLHLP